MKQSPLLWFALLIAAVAGLALFGPEEKSLGANVRIVYVHAAWVWTANIALLLASVSGFLALLRDRKILLNFSGALGRTGIFYWVTYLPLSLWAMQANWNGLFLEEPRFRLALTFAVVGVLLQAGLWLLNNPYYTAAGNALFGMLLFYSLFQTPEVMHPGPSPIFSSDLWQVKVFFLLMCGLTLASAFFLTRWWLKIAPQKK